METDISTTAPEANQPDVDINVVQVVVNKPDETPGTTVAASDTPSVGEIVEEIVDSVLGDSDDDVDGQSEFVIADPETITVGESMPVVPETETAASDNLAALEETFPASELDPSETAEAEAHAVAATEAQARAEDAVAAGDYETASQFRETAENEAWEAVDSSMLEGATSAELESAADYQARAEEYEREEEQQAAAGDYESAREAAAHAADATDWADFKAGGDDHSASAEAAYNKDDWAVWEQQQAQDAEQSAEAYASEGDFESAEVYAESAAEHQLDADTYGQEDAYVDYSADTSVDTSSTYEAPDTTSYDSGE